MTIKITGIEEVVKVTADNIDQYAAEIKDAPERHRRIIISMFEFYKTTNPPDTKKMWIYAAIAYITQRGETSIREIIKEHEEKLQATK